MILDRFTLGEPSSHMTGGKHLIYWIYINRQYSTAHDL